MTDGHVALAVDSKLVLSSKDLRCFQGALLKNHRISLRKNHLFKVDTFVTKLSASFVLTTLKILFT